MAKGTTKIGTRNKFLSFFGFKSQPAKRKYEGASKKKRLKGWYASNRSAMSEISLDLETLRNRSRDLRRNNPYAAKAITVISSNVVGTGIKTQFRNDEGATPDSDGPFETAWKQWAHTTNIDFDGHHDIYGLQSLAMEAIAESGEVLIRKRITAGLTFPLQYQVLEPDFLDNTHTALPLENGNTIVQGIEFDPQGRRVAYHIYETHPGGLDAFGLRSNLKSNRIPADEIMHLFRMDRPGQARGVPWCSPAIVRMKDLDDFEDAQLVRQKIAACFTAFVRDINGDMSDEEDDCELPERVEPGIIEELPAGKMVDFVTPPGVQGYAEYVSTLLHAIAAGYGITYEELTGDLSGVNFSSGRMGWLSFHRNIKKWRDQILITGFMKPLIEDFKQVMAIQGIENNRVVAVHTPPRREMIDPTKEVPAILQSIRAGITSLSDEVMAQGKDPKDHLKQMQKDLELLDELGIVLDMDPRKTGLNGRAQQIETSQSEEGESDE